MGIFNFLTIFLSYGQIFQMGIWKDDNAIFFKLQHINESTGFFGKGLIGEGPYRFSFTPYWFIYKLFGNSSTFPYYLLIFIFYILAAFLVSKFVSKFVSEKAGKVAGLLFACGFIASEGFYWLANAMVSDVSIIFLSLCLFFYYKYFLNRKLWFYLSSIILFWASAYFTPIRAYYFIGIIFLFEIIFFVSQKRRNIFTTLLRFIPFLGIFYYFFITSGDGRTGLLKDVFSSIISGKFYIFYGFLSSLANIIFPDTLTSRFFDWEVNFIKITGIGLPYVIFATLALSLVGLFLLFRKKKLILFFSTILILWSIFSNHFFNFPIINLNNTTNYVVYLGGIILIFAFAIIFVINQTNRRKYIFLLGSFLLSIAAYWFYEPLVVFNTTHRYMVGAFFVLVCLFAFLYVNSNRFVKSLIIFWGVFNLVSSITYQHQILSTRSFPVENFYRQLKTYKPLLNKGDLYYFDLANFLARDHFNNAISTASMPDETSFAWRYGVDRYDFKIVSDFASFINYIKIQKVSYDNIHSFYYSGDKLIDTTSEMRDLLKNGTEFKKIKFEAQDENGNLKINLSEPITTLTPGIINLTLVSQSPDFSRINFPYVTDSSFSINSVAVDRAKRNEAFSYFQNKSEILKGAKIMTSSDWMGDLPENLIDDNSQTNWRSNRLLWGKEKTYLTLDLGKIYNIGEFVWINGFGNSTVTKYSLEISSDGVIWKNIKNVSSSLRIDSKDPQVISFEPQNLRYIKMNLLETLDTDAPQIAEVWVVPSIFNDLDIKDTEKFLLNPFGYVSNVETFKETLKNLKNSGIVSLDNISQTKIIYNEIPRTYSFQMPAGGINIFNLNLRNLQIPGNLVLKGVSFRNLKLDEIMKKL